MILKHLVFSDLVERSHGYIERSRLLIFKLLKSFDYAHHYSESEMNAFHLYKKSIGNLDI